MSGGDDLSRLGNLPLGYVTQVQLQESTEKITQTVQAQLQAFAEEFLRRLPPPAQPTTSAAPQHSTSRHSAALIPQPPPVQPVQPPETPYIPRQRRERNEGHSLPMQTQPAPRRLHPRRLPVHEVVGESPGPSHRVPESAAEASRHHRSERPAPAASTHKSTDDYSAARRPIADDVIGSTL